MIWLRIGLFRRFQHTAARRRLAQQIPLNVSIASSFNTQPPEGGWFSLRPLALLPTWFQHTAARRRLAYQTGKAVREEKVSTHSRPKAAGASLKSLATSGFASLISLNSQEKQKCEYNTAFSVIPTFAIS